MDPEFPPRPGFEFHDHDRKKMLDCKNPEQFELKFLEEIVTKEIEVLGYSAMEVLV